MKENVNNSITFYTRIQQNNTLNDLTYKLHPLHFLCTKTISNILALTFRMLTVSQRLCKKVFIFNHVQTNDLAYYLNNVNIRRCTTTKTARRSTHRTTSIFISSILAEYWLKPMFPWPAPPPASSRTRRTPSSRTPHPKTESFRRLPEPGPMKFLVNKSNKTFQNFVRNNKQIAFTTLNVKLSAIYDVSVTLEEGVKSV